MALKEGKFNLEIRWSTRDYYYKYIIYYNIFLLEIIIINIYTRDYYNKYIIAQRSCGCPIRDGVQDQWALDSLATLPVAQG